jgi:hypothetical protein
MAVKKAAGVKKAAAKRPAIKTIGKQDVHKHVLMHAAKMVRSFHATLREAGIRDMKIQEVHVSSCGPNCDPPCKRVSIIVGGSTIVICSEP